MTGGRETDTRSLVPRAEGVIYEPQALEGLSYKLALHSEGWDTVERMVASVS